MVIIRLKGWFCMTVTERIDCIIQSRKISRRQLAIKAGIPPSSLQSAMARGKNISFEMLQKIANALEVDVSELLGINPLPPTTEEWRGRTFKVSPEGREFNAFLDFAKSMGYEFEPYGDYNEPEEDYDPGYWYDCLLTDIRSNNETAPHHDMYWIKSSEFEEVMDRVQAFFKFQMSELIQKYKDEPPK